MYGFLGTSFCSQNFLKSLQSELSSDSTTLVEKELMVPVFIGPHSTHPKIVLYADVSPQTFFLIPSIFMNLSESLPNIRSICADWLKCGSAKSKTLRSVEFVTFGKTMAEIVKRTSYFFDTITS